MSLLSHSLDIGKKSSVMTTTTTMNPSLFPQRGTTSTAKSCRATSGHPLPTHHPQTSALQIHSPAVAEGHGNQLPRTDALIYRAYLVPQSKLFLRPPEHPLASTEAAYLPGGKHHFRSMNRNVFLSHQKYFWEGEILLKPPRWAVFPSFHGPAAFLPLPWKVPLNKVGICISQARPFSGCHPFACKVAACGSAPKGRINQLGEKNPLHKVYPSVGS